MQIPGMCLYQTYTEALETSSTARKVRSIFAQAEAQAFKGVAQLWITVQMTLILSI